MQWSYTRLTTQQWEIIGKILPMKQKGKYKLRDIVDAILWQLRIGAQWHNLPDNFPKQGSVYYYFRKWKSNGALEMLNIKLNMMERIILGKEATPSLLSIDQSVYIIRSIIHHDKGVDGNKKLTVENDMLLQIPQD